MKLIKQILKQIFKSKKGEESINYEEIKNKRREMLLNSYYYNPMNFL